MPVPNTEIHWAGNRKSAPPDTPKCGFDGAKCPPESRNWNEGFFSNVASAKFYAIQNSCNLYSFIFYFDILYYRTVPRVRNCDHRPWFSPCYRCDCGLLYIQVRLPERGWLRRCFKARLIMWCFRARLGSWWITSHEYITHPLLGLKLDYLNTIIVGVKRIPMVKWKFSFC